MRPWLLVSVAVGLDQFIKLVIRHTLSPIQSVPLIPSVIHLTYVQNSGAAFGLFPGHTSLFILVSVAVAGWVCVELIRLRTGTQAPRTQAGLILILSGALGNLIDRLWFGYVIDFIDLRVWPVFNVADSCITIGVGLLLWQAVRPRGASATASSR